MHIHDVAKLYNYTFRNCVIVKFHHIMNMQQWSSACMQYKAIISGCVAKWEWACIVWSFNQQSRLELYDLKLAIYIFKFIMDKL